MELVAKQPARLNLWLCCGVFRGKPPRVAKWRYRKNCDQPDAQGCCLRHLLAYFVFHVDFGKQLIHTAISARIYGIPSALP